MSANFKENIKKYYDQEAELRNSKSDKADWKAKARSAFFDLIKQENKQTLLELGAGAGYDSQFFMNKGLKVTAVDLSSEMVMKCKEKSIEAYELDFYNLSSLRKNFECIYAINTLLHVPKDDLRSVLNEIDLVLAADGLFYMGLYGGEDIENELVTSEVSDTPRFFAFHSESYLRKVLQERFQIYCFETFDVDKGAKVVPFHSIILRKRAADNS